MSERTGCDYCDDGAKAGTGVIRCVCETPCWNLGCPKTRSSPPRRPTTAERLVEYRDELLAVGFPPNEVAEMLRRAAARPNDFTTEADKERQHQESAYQMQCMLLRLRLAYGWDEPPTRDDDALPNAEPEVEPECDGPFRRALARMTRRSNV